MQIIFLASIFVKKQPSFNLLNLTVSFKGIKSFFQCRSVLSSCCQNSEKKYKKIKTSHPPHFFFQNLDENLNTYLVGPNCPFILRINTVEQLKSYCKFGNFCKNFIFANSVKIHICDYKFATRA